MINWQTISERIMDFIDLNEDNRPSYHKIDSYSVKFLGIDKTMFRSSKDGDSMDQLWLNETEDGKMILYKLFHECWHAYQKSKGYEMGYSDEDRLKYVGKQHMMMLYKYPFEAEATGYAAAFVYTVYKFSDLLNKKCFDKKIEDSYTNIELFPEKEFDTKNDYLIINEQIETNYEKGKSYIKNQFNTSLSNEMESVIEDCKVNDEFKKHLVSKKGFIIFEIISELSK